jgi:hypothetical protein
MNALLQAFGLGLGAAVYVLLALWLVRALRDGSRLSVALYWRLRSEAEDRAQLARVVELRTRRPEPVPVRQRRRAA